MASRQRHLAASEEEELFMLQDQMKVTHGPPSAAVTRIKKPAAQPAASSAAACCSDPNHDHDHNSSGAPQMVDLADALKRAMGGILGDVKEHATPSQPPALAPMLPSGDQPAFPKAMHRKQSKFSLARKNPQQPSLQTENNGSQPPVQNTPSVSQATAGASTSSGAGAIPSNNEAAGVDAESSRMLAEMSESEVAEAREELMKKLSPEAVAFLRKRAAQRKNSAAVGGGGGGSSGNKALGPGQPSTAPFNSTKKPTPPPQQPQPQTPAARLRFDVNGQVVGVRPREDTTNTSTATTSSEAAPSEVSVVSRDPVRQGEGGSTAAIEGYTVAEACILARSTVPQQRAIALRLLASVLGHSRPQQLQQQQQQDSPSMVPIPSDILSEYLSGASGDFSVKWLDVWHHALHSACVSKVLRFALDDTNMSVVAAASEALAALLCPSYNEQEALESADSNPLVGWPGVPARHMQRPTATSSWVCSPVDLHAQRQRQRAAAAAAAVGALDQDKDDENVVDEQELAKVDPLGGIVNMQLLERVAYVLGVLRAPGAILPLLSVLSSVCSAGKDAAEKVARTPGLLEALVKVLGASSSSSSASLESQPQLGSKGGSAADAACVEARPAALRCIRALCQNSLVAARLVHEAGLSRFVYPPLLAYYSYSSTTSSLSSSISSLGGFIEALRIWRCMALHGQYLIHMDDVFPTLCRHLAPSWKTSPITSKESGGSGDSTLVPALAEWAVAREGYLVLAQLCWHSARAGGGEAGMISPECSSAVAKDTLEWLEQAGAALWDFLAAEYVDNKDDRNTSISIVGRVSSSPAISLQQPPTALLLSTVSAAVHFLGSYWATATWMSAEEKAAASQTLRTIGILPDGSKDNNISKSNIKTSVFQRAVASMVSSAIQRGLSSSATDVFSLGAAIGAGIGLSRLGAALGEKAAGVAQAAILDECISSEAVLLLQKRSSALDSTLLQPWDCPALLEIAMLSRGAAAAGVNLSPSATKNEQTHRMPSLEASLAALCALPPGMEDDALRLMASVFSSGQVQPVVDAAKEFIEQGKSELAPLATSQEDGEGEGSINAPPAAPSTEILGSVLLAGYAASLLGMVQEEPPISSEGQSGIVPLEAPFSTAVLQPEGSMLPLAPTWMLDHPPVPPPISYVTANTTSSIGYALLWTLGLKILDLSGTFCEETIAVAGAGSGAGGISATPSKEATATAIASKLKAAILMIFDPSLSSEGAETECWRDPLVRWAMAGLLHHYITISTTQSQSATSPHALLPTAAAPSLDSEAAITWRSVEARRLTEYFASSSYGDCLFGAAVAILLRSDVSLDTQLEMLSVLLDERALPLLPPIELCPGHRGSYFGAPHSKAAEDLYMRLLSMPDFLACVDTGSMALPLVLHRLASSIFERGEQEEVDVRRSALLRAAVRRLAGNIDGGASAGVSPQRQQKLQVLSMLLRWSCEEWQPVDVVSAERLAFIKQACAGQGGEGLLEAALAALHA